MVHCQNEGPNGHGSKDSAACCGGGCHDQFDFQPLGHHDPGDESQGGRAAAPKTQSAAPQHFAPESFGPGPSASRPAAPPHGWQQGWGDDPGDETQHSGSSAAPVHALHAKAPPPPEEATGPAFRAVPASRGHHPKADPGPAPSLPILAVLYDVPEFTEPPPQLTVQPLHPLPTGPEGDETEAQGAEPGWLERWQDAVRFNNSIREGNDSAAAGYRQALTDYHIRRDECYRETQWARDQNRHLSGINRDRIAAYNAALSVWLAAGGSLEESHGWLVLPAGEDAGSDVLSLTDAPQVA